LHYAGTDRPLEVIALQDEIVSSDRNIQSYDHNFPGLFISMSRLVDNLTSTLQGIAHVRHNIDTERATLFQELVDLQLRVVIAEQQIERINLGNRFNIVTRRMGVLGATFLFARIAETTLSKKLSDSQRILELGRHLEFGNWESSWSQGFRESLERLKNVTSYLENVKRTFDAEVARVTMEWNP
jgi:hypothetical protein